MRNRTGDEGRQTGGVAARAHIHVHIHILIRWQVDTSSTVALYSHTMCNLEQRRAPSSRSSWPNKHGIIIFSWICRSKRGAQPPRPLAAGDRRSFTQVAWGSHPFLRAADTALCAARSGLACSATRGVYAILRRTASSPVRDHSWCLSWFLVLLFAHFIPFSLSRPPIPFPRQFVSYKKRRASFACYTWVKIYLDRRRKSTSHVPSLAISCNKLNTTRHTSEIVSQKGWETLP